MEKESKSLAAANPLKVMEDLKFSTGIATLTPDKTTELLRSKTGPVELPEKHKMLVELFEHMNCSLRLLRLCNKMPTFRNVSTQIEVLYKRKFSHRHLAQMKYVLPEAVQIDRIVVHDKKTLCMKPDMKITLQFDVVDDHQENSSVTALRQLFASRVLDFFNKHLMDTCIPEATLPEPFNQKIGTISKGALHVDSSGEPQLTPDSIESISSLSSLHPSFSRHFSEKTFVDEMEKTQLLTCTVPFSPATIDCLDSHDSRCGEQGNPLGVCSELNDDKIVQKCNTPICGTPILKLHMESDNWMVETPALSEPKRSMPSCDKNLQIVSSKIWSSCQKPTKRFLDFTMLEGNEVDTKSFVKPKYLDDMPKPCTIELSESAGEKIVTESVSLARKVRNSEDCAAEVHNLDKKSVKCDYVCTKMSELVTTIHQIFRTVNRSSITKEELVHKIISESFDFTEKGEVEEQIAQLEKIVPDWIFKKMAPSGDLIYIIKDVADLSIIHARLVSM